MTTLAAPTATSPELSVQEAHRLVRDLLTPKMWVYWTDFLLSLTTGVVAFALAAAWSFPTVPGVLAWAVSVLALYRAAVFLHEIVHFSGRRSFTAFRQAWNVLCGIPLLMPVFMYDCHKEHHNKRHYGTTRDAEYIPLAQLPPSRILGLLAASPLLPLFGPYRFGVMTPLAWVFPRLRPYVYTRLSTLKLDLEYAGRLPADDRERRSWRAQEVACLGVVATAATLVATGVVAPAVLLQWYLTMAGLMGLNTLRLLGAHRYLGDEDEMTLAEQVLDTYNYPRRRWVGELWAPVGLRLHAVHHLLPALPYHAYDAAHARLTAGLAANSPYHTTTADGLWRSIRTLWRTARSSTAAGAR